MLGYSFILTGDGYPCVFWWTTSTANLRVLRRPTNRRADRRASSPCRRGVDRAARRPRPLHHAARRTDQQTGLVYVLNNLGNRWSGTQVKTKWTNQRFKPVAWDGHDTAHPDERTSDAEGNAEFPAPPRGYCVYAPFVE